MEDRETFLQKKKVFKTNLIRKGPAPGAWGKLILPAGTRETVYPSHHLRLKTVILFPDNWENVKSPAVVLFHGGTSLRQEFLSTAPLPFLKSGFIVMLPTTRGENGNEGFHELFLGEVDDACASLMWLAQEPYIDKRNIYMFGYSMGGEIAALLSLYEDLPIVFGGSCGAFFGRADMFGAESMFNNPVPFDPTADNEKELRTLAGNLSGMNYTHYAFIGKKDEKFSAKAYKKLDTENSKLEIIEVEGDHDTSLEFALNKFLKIISASSRENMI
jgi:dienelactone hydrolase